MDITKTLGLAVALIVFSGANAPQARAAEGSSAASLSAAVGGSLGEGMLDAGSVGHGRLTLAELRIARSEAFRRRVAVPAQTEGSGVSQSAALHWSATARGRVEARL